MEAAKKPRRNFKRVAYEHAAGWLSSDADACDIAEGYSLAEEEKIREHIRQIAKQLGKKGMPL